MAKRNPSLEDEWRRKLLESGFRDIEDRFGNLKQHDIRTATWEVRESILDFYLRLDRFMTFYDEMPIFDRRVMELYSQGYQIREIARQINKSAERRVYYIIKHYKTLVLAIQRMESEEARADFPHPLKPKSNRDSRM